MAECFDLQSRLNALKKQRAKQDELKRLYEGEANQLSDDPSQRRVTRLKMVSGDYLEIDPQKFWDQVERDAMALGDADIEEAVRAAIDNNARPQGSRGLNINYAQLEPSDLNIAKLLKVLDLEFGKSDGAAKLRKPYTEGAADKAFLVTAQAYGADPRALADAMSRKLAGIDKLPTNAYIVNRVRRDAVRYYADVLEEAADLILQGSMTPAAADQVGNAARWAHYWQQLDTKVSRSVAQALRTRQFGDWVNEVSFMKMDTDLEKLTYEDITGGSLAQQILDHINDGDPYKLKQLATAARLDSLSNQPLNKPGFRTQVEILNTYRKDNLFSSLNTWLVRNPAAVFVSAHYGLEDIVEGVLKYGVGTELEAAGHAFRSLYMGMNTTWRNAWDAFAYGKPTLAYEQFAELSPDVVLEAKNRVNEDLNQAWEMMLNPAYHLKSAGIGTAVTGLNLFNLSFRRFLLGPLFEQGSNLAAKVTGKDIGGVTAGYTPAFRALAGGDEVIRKIAFDWKVNHEAWLRASKEAKEGGFDSTWIRNRAEEMASKAVFDGVMTDEQLAQLKLREIGVAASDMDNDELRLTMFNNLNGTPDTADELGKLGAARGDAVTFTQKLDDPITGGIQQMRQNPLMAFVMPVWRSPANGMKWLLSRDIYTRIPLQLYREAVDALGEGGTLRGGPGAMDPDLLAQSRAATAVSAFFAANVALLWQAGIFSDGGPTNREDRQRWEDAGNKPYSFSLSLGAFQALKMGVNSIDLFDLMGLQADIHRAHHEGRLDNNSFTTMMEGLATAYGRVFMNKSALTGVTSILNAVIRAGQGAESDWFEALRAQTNGVLPMSGLFTQASRATKDPNQVPSKFRTLTTAEYTALNKDPNWEWAKYALGRLFKDYPVLGNVFPAQTEERDWLGRRIERPLGLPSDVTTPFMPIIKGKDPLSQWLFTHGLGMKPRPDAVISGEQGFGPYTRVTMSKEQEATYREAMRTIRGDVPVAAVLGSRNAVINLGTSAFSIDRYVRGNTLQQALTLLSQDPDYNLELASPAGPSLVAQPNRSLSERTGSTSDPLGVYKVYEAVVSYYDRRALQAMVAQHPEMVEQAQAGLNEIRTKIQKRLEMSPIGARQQ